MPRNAPLLKSLVVCFLVASALAAPARAEKTLGVDSTAARFSPGLWAGDAGRGGKAFRRTWAVGAWCEWRWTTPGDRPSATLLVTNQTPKSTVSWFLDGVLTENVAVPARGGVPLAGLNRGGDHTLLVYTAHSEQADRWEGANAYTVSGLAVDDEASALPAAPPRPWVLIVGDSITEGSGASSSLGDYAFLVGQGLRCRGYDTSVSACGWSGWVRPGDGNGDVPGYYAVHGGTYSESASRWDKIDAHTSLLDADGRLSGQGETGQEPAAVVINYMVNECLHGADPHDAQASVAGCLAALRKAAPKAALVVLMPPGLQDAGVYPKNAAYVEALRAGVADYQKANPGDAKTVLVDFGPEVARAGVQAVRRGRPPQRRRARIPGTDRPSGGPQEPGCVTCQVRRLMTCGGRRPVPRAGRATPDRAHFTPLHSASPRFTPLHPASPRFTPLHPASPRFTPLHPASPRTFVSTHSRRNEPEIKRRFFALDAPKVVGEEVLCDRVNLRISHEDAHLGGREHFGVPGDAAADQE